MRGLRFHISWASAVTEALLLGFLALHLRDEFLAEPGVGAEALVELGDLGAEVFLFQFEQGFRAAFFQPGSSGVGRSRGKSGGRLQKPPVAGACVASEDR
jgi:hypothetical protein